MENERIFWASELGEQVCLMGKIVEEEGKKKMVILKSRIGNHFQDFNELLEHEQVFHVFWAEKMKVRSGLHHVNTILSKTERIIFMELSLRANEIVPQADLIEKLKAEGKSEFSLRSLIGSLRKKIVGYYQLSIRTHYSKGYSLEFSETGFLDPDDPSR